MVLAALVAPLVLQAAAMIIDERWYHRRRALPRWERMGHPLDTLSAVVCYLWLIVARPSAAHAVIYASLAIASSLFVTKDEPVHSRVCSAGEHWIHSVLFLLHPVVLIVVGYLWWTARWRAIIVAELAAAIGFATYQLLYWNGPWRSARGAQPSHTSSLDMHAEKSSSLFERPRTASSVRRRGIDCR